MTRREKFLLFIWAICAVVLVADRSRAASDNFPSGTMAGIYDVDAQTFASPNQRTALASADTLTTAAILATPEFRVRQRQTIFVSGRFTAASQTCTVQIAYVYKSGNVGTASATDTAINKIKGWSSVITLTGSASQKEGTYYEAPDAFFDTEGATTLRVLLISAPASGTVTLVTGS